MLIRLRWILKDCIVTAACHGVIGPKTAHCFIWSGFDSCLIAHDTVKFLVPVRVLGYLMKRSV
jgi:hypothetical protein